MSRVGKKPIEIPAKVKVAIQAQTIRVEGPKGKLEKTFIPREVTVKQSGTTLTVSPNGEERTHRALQGMTRAIINNMVVGVTQGFTRELEINGVGYRAEVGQGGKLLTMQLGYSHPVVFPLPEGITAAVDAKQTKITLTGIDRELLGQTAANLRAKKPPEPYKGKGIKYVEERIRMKEGKAGAS
jgi:large subunit ribosomal protein L6